MENLNSDFRLISSSLIEAQEPAHIVEIFYDTIIRTEYFLMGYPTFFYETQLWFGNPSLLQLDIYDRQSSTSYEN